MKWLSRFRLAPEGADVILTSVLLLIVATVLQLFLTGFAAKVILILAVLWAFGVLQFFRDPMRTPPTGNKLIVSPADGKIIDISPSAVSPIKPNGIRIAIFMSPINVHVNRAPSNGTVEETEYRTGKFITAFNPDSERVNERMLVTMRTPFGKIAFSQVAGYLARRIIFHPKKGTTLNTGQRVGMIRFGSRSDVYLPDNVTILVKNGQIVKAGETILGEFTSES